jgi:hypothetical protein
MKSFFTFIVIALLIPTTTHAVVVSIVPPTDTVGVQQQFFIDVVVDTEGAAINAVESLVRYSTETLRLVRVEDGQSIVPLWIEQPRDEGGTISFAGIIPNGYAGTIDPFDRERVLPGVLVRLVFEAVAAGTATISADTTVTNNDGQGTAQTLPSMATAFRIAEIPSSAVYRFDDVIAPTLSAQRVRDPNLFDNVYTLIFDAQDKESGVAYVEVKEKKHEWKKVTSPYRLEDQRDDATLQVRAFDNARNMTMITIGDTQPSFAQLVVLALVLIVGFPLMVLLYKRYGYKK